MSSELPRRLRITLAALALALAACDVGAEDAGDTAPDAHASYTKVFTIQQPAAPALQQLINSCASGFDHASCDTMCKAVVCDLLIPAELEVYGCSLSRSGPIARITVTFNGPIFCPPPPPFPGGFP